MASCCWAGHVARMGHERLPRRFLTSWIRNPRPHGPPQFTYGHSLNKTLEWAGISHGLRGVERTGAGPAGVARAHPRNGRVPAPPPHPRAAEAAEAAAAAAAAEEEVGQTWWCHSSRPRKDGPSRPPPARRSSCARARTNSNSTLTRGGDATRAPHTITHTLPYVCLLFRWTDTHSHQHLACGYWESTN